MEEGELNRKRQREEQARIKEQEKKDLENYMHFIDKQEAEQKKREKERERRTQELMSQMADSTMKDIEKKKIEDEERVLRYMQETEIRDRLDEEQRLKRMKENQEDMRNYLKLQVKERKNKAITEKKEDYKQAEMWKKDIQVHEDEERKIRLKILMANREYAEYLKKQMEDNKKSKISTMNKDEYLMNKKLMEEIQSRNRQKHTFTS